MHSSKMLKLIDRVSVVSGRAISLIAVPMIAALVYEVFARYFLKRPTIWSYEITYMIYGTHYLLGTAYTLHVKGHIRIDLIYMKLSPRRRSIIDVLGYLIIFFPVVGLMVISSYNFARDAYIIGEVSQFTPWQPLLWPFKSMILIGFSLLFLQGLAEFIRSFVMLVKGESI